MSKIFILLGFSTPTENSPSFSTPVFKQGESLYLQIIDEQEQIRDFEKIENIDIDVYQASCNTEYTIGDEAIYAIRNHRNQLIQHNKTNMDKYLKENSRQFISYPFFYKSASEFSHLDSPEFRGCRNNKDYLLLQILSNAAKEFIKPINNQKLLQNGKNKGDKQFHPYEPAHTQIDKALNFSQDSLRSSYFEKFISFAQSKHQKLAREKAVIESLILSAYISHILPDDIENLESVRSNLINMLENSKIDLSPKTYESVKPSQLKRKKRHSPHIKLIPRKIIDQNSDGLSLIIFITTTINHFKSEHKFKQK